MSSAADPPPGPTASSDRCARHELADEITVPIPLRPGLLAPRLGLRGYITVHSGQLAVHSGRLSLGWHPVTPELLQRVLDRLQDGL